MENGDRRPYLTKNTHHKGKRLLPAVLGCCFVLAFLLRHSDLPAQCTTVGPTLIPDDGVVTIGFSVSGLVDANLNSPTQGICGVDIEFNHEYLGDLTVTLVSPSGTSVVLIGDATTATGNTNVTNWDIQFLPCGMPANPDAGFTAMWSNDQVWEALTFYNGSYYPFDGCLEDFNSGPANGIWQIIIEDHGEFALGTVISATLIFCNPAGLSCQECAPNAGSISPASITRCAGENIQSSSLTIDYGPSGPPNAEYLYQFLLVSGNTIVQHGSFFSAIPPVGVYTLCGLSYHVDDTVFVDAVLESGDYDILQQFIVDANICAQLTAPCVDLIIESPPDTLTIDTNLCQGEVFSYGGQNYTTTGIFFQTQDGPGACDTVVEIHIAPRQLTIDIPVPDTLNCGGNQVNLSSTATGATGPFTFTWTTTFGNIVSAPNLSTVIVDQAGPYAVSITDGICSNTANVSVLADQGFPQVFVSGGLLSCTQNTVNLQPIYIPSDGIASWTGPAGFMSSQPNISVSIPGNYFLTITNQQGCATTESVIVLTDTATLPVSIYPLPKNCIFQNIILGINSPLHIAGADWTGPNGFIFSSPIFGPTVSDPGLYSVTVTFDNGCQRSATYFFDADFTIPDLTVPVTDTLNCNEVVSLVASSSVPGAQFYWTGPESFFSNQSTIQVSQTGAYIAVVTAPNGCTSQAGVTVEEGGDLFDFQLFTDTITCLQDTVPIQVISSAADLFDWINYIGPDQGMSVIHVTTPGLYTVMMTDTQSGCEITTSIFVPGNLAVPSFGYTTDTITCADPVATLAFVPFAGYTYINVYWELPDFTIVTGDTLQSGLSGIHRLNAVGPNGCVGTWVINIPRDTLPPFLLVESDTLSCMDTISILTQSLDSVSSYTWSGPGIILDLGTSIDANIPGIYTLEATGLNGCVSEFSIIVDSNFVLPQFQIVHDSLRCDQLASLAGVSTDTSLRYAWYDDTGQILSTDSLFQTNVPGLYTVEVRGSNNCIDTDTVRLFPLSYAEVSLTSDTLTCAVLSVSVVSDIDIVPASTIWTNPIGDTISMMPVVSVSDGGPFILHVTGQNGCVTLDTISVPYDTIPPDAVIELIGEVRCQLLEVMFSGLQSTPSNLSYAWSTIGGNIIGTNTAPNINARDTGLYFLTIVRIDNGCSDLDSFHLTPSPDAIVQADLSITRATCNGDMNGSIEVAGVVGGIGPFLYQLNSGAFQTNIIFNGLPAGSHFLTILDAEGCAYDTLITIQPTPSYLVDAGPDVEIYLGESIELQGTTDLIADEIMDQRWDSLGTTLCIGCPLLEVSPWETTTYAFIVESVTGCLLSDHVTVFVIEKGKYFIPNIFSPNGDGINEEVRLHPTPGIQRVLKWIIFDRWGNAVFGRTDFDPNDQTVFWNGQTTTGEYANPAIFPYLIEYQLINGNRELRHGDITLIR